MTPTKAAITRYFSLAVLSGAILAGGAASAMAAEHQIGTITERLETGFILQTADGATVTVAFTDKVKIVVEHGSGKWTVSELVPGLPVKVTGVYDGATLLAKEIKFSHADRKLAGLSGNLRPLRDESDRSSRADPAAPRINCARL